MNSNTQDNTATRQQCTAQPSGNRTHRLPGRHLAIVPLLIAICLAAAILLCQLSLISNGAGNGSAQAPRNAIANLAGALFGQAAPACVLTIVAAVALCLSLYVYALMLQARAVAGWQTATAAQREGLERALFEAQASAAGANQAKAELADRMGRAAQVHLNHILNTTELLTDGGASDEQQEYLQEIRDAADSLAKVASDSMDLSAIGAGKLELEAIDFGLRSCLAYAMESMRPRAKDKGLELQAGVDGNVPDALRGDPGRLRQVLGNLLSNAIKFTDHGTVKVTVGCESQTADSVALRVSVCDSGRGMAPQRLEQINRMFKNPESFMGSDSLAGGLLISAQLANLMGGRMWADSQINHGSTFHFTLNLRTAPAAATAKPGKAVDLRGMGVLLAGSSAARMEKLRQILSGWQMLVSLAPTGQSAMEILAEASKAGRPLPLAIMDDDVADMDGFALAQRISREPAAAKTTLFVLTRTGQRGDPARCTQLGITAYLAGPITPSILHAAIVAAFQPAAGPRPLLTRHWLREADSRSTIRTSAA